MYSFSNHWKKGMQEGSNKLTVTFEDGTKTACTPGTQLKNLLHIHKSPEGLDYIGALVNNDVVSLSYPIEVDSEVRLITLSDSHGDRIYRRSACFILAKTVKELFPTARFAVEHSLGSGVYCSFETGNHGGNGHADVNGNAPGITPEQLFAIERRMIEQVNADLPIKRRKIAFIEAMKQFEDEKQRDKYNLLRFRNPPKIVVFWCEGFSDLAHGPLTASTGVLGLFKLIPYPPGFVIQFPERENPVVVAPFEPQPHLFHIYQEHKEWGRILGVTTVGRLNEIIAGREIGDFIKIAEALHEKKIAKIADHVYGNRN
ncbi:MAG: hypothetical protein BWK77_03355, partial [Verrucomicrobia bacterium A1]